MSTVLRKREFFTIVFRAKNTGESSASLGRNFRRLWETVFERCKICHTVEAGGRNTVGPNLHGVFGRKAGTVDGFTYSDAMKTSGIVWDDDAMAKYLRNPRELVPGGKMAFPGIKDDAQLADVIAYLHQATQ